MCIAIEVAKITRRHRKHKMKIVGNFEIKKAMNTGSRFSMLMNHKDRKLGLKQSLSGEN